ncbi:pyridoxamine 5'-phosphate oxidase family protein [Kribbella sp. NPDC003505]|uniref:pyridoxamine 5'-phosphate oxidase family protein n=1 Tax=Kribbella sp. NPDC003505 TaxID=3154448 RepID=UPI0033B7651C
MKTVAISERLGLVYRRWALRRRIDTPAEVVKVAMANVRRTKYCMFVTETEHGPAARVLEPFRPTRDGLIQFGTDPTSRKIADIVRTGRCLLVYQGAVSCVSLECDATIEDWPAAGLPRFKPSWRAFWPAGPDRSDYIVVTCRPTAMEVWDGRAVVAPGSFGLRSLRLEQTAGEWHPAAPQ